MVFVSHDLQVVSPVCVLCPAVSVTQLYVQYVQYQDILLTGLLLHLHLDEQISSRYRVTMQRSAYI